MNNLEDIKEYLSDLYISTDNEDVLFLLNNIESHVPFIEDSFKKGFDDVWVIDQLLTYATQLDGEFTNANDYD